MSLSNKAMLVKLFISQWTARKLDRNITREVIQSKGASEDSGRWNKALIAQDAIQTIQKVVGKARTFHYDNSLAWDDNGARILPAMNYLDYTREVNNLKAEFEKVVEEFVRNYPQLVEESKQRLNGMYDETDYPTSDQIRYKFGFEVVFYPMPDAADFRVTLAQGEVDRIKADIENRVKNSVTHAMQDLWNRLQEVVKKMSDKLNDPEGEFRNSLVGNIIDLVSVLPKLNLTNDPELERIRRDVEDKLTRWKPDSLRHDKSLRKSTAKAASEILNDMSGYLSNPE